MKLQHLLCKCEKDPVFILYIQDFVVFSVSNKRGLLSL